MSESSQDNAVTVIIGDDALSQDLSEESNNQNPLVLIIIKKQKEIKYEIIRLEAKLDMLNELMVEHVTQNLFNNDDDNISMHST